ncbi:type IX secretion system membrane protein PorP/SprF [Zeaxanthinibacter enoshimensis]|uniref:PorP/SprF family type IX secretion system membrane protein n=1 Tax=Zeaxanthinibacter enoshimensis TaxID=392009 RepID=UPI00356686AF
MESLKKYIVLMILVVCSGVNAQQLPQFTQYMFNTISVNPAYAGSRGTLNLTALHRNQWTGIEGNPRTNTFSLHAPLRNDRIGLGLSYINDRLGFEKTNYIYGDFSYTIPVTQAAKLSFGLKAGFTNYYLESPDGSDPFFNANFTQWSPNIGAGTFLSTDRWYVGISSPRILNTDLNEGEFQAVERNSYYAIGGYVVDLSENLKFKPTMLSKFTNGAPSSYDLSAYFLYSEKIWFGATYRLNNSSGFGALIDYQISKDFRIGYAYDTPTGDLKPYSSGTHEVILIYETGFKKLGPAKSPRYF